MQLSGKLQLNSRPYKTLETFMNLSRSASCPHYDAQDVYHSH